MSARAVVSGFLFRVPASKTSRAGKPYIFATIREGAGDAIRWWKCFAFSESTIDEFLRLSDGDPIAVAGEFDCELYSPAGAEARLSWKIVADAVLSAKARPKARPKKEPRKRETRASGPPSIHQHQGRLNDDIPF
ncbi:MAG: single-stranded DNA-binding protein [Roseiarcus sp.]|uniref:single-stranded DNA-binding protein n=1 Tax=Roseiarcus sp. TaxID=1969460 RepID=UPI003C58AE40